MIEKIILAPSAFSSLQTQEVSKADPYLMVNVSKLSLVPRLPDLFNVCTRKGGEPGKRSHVKRVIND